MQTNSLRLLLAGITCCLLACGPRSPEGKLLANAYKAIQENSWDDFKEHTVPVAILEARQQGINLFEQQQSFLGGVLAEEERERQRQQFLRIASEHDPFDPSQARFRGISKEVRQGEIQLLMTEIGLPYDEYSLRLEDASGEFDSRERGVTFLVAQHGTLPRIIAIKFEP